jgi:hypothetical protein
MRRRNDDRRQFNVRVNPRTINLINELMERWGCNSQGEVIDVLASHAPANDPREQLAVSLRGAKFPHEVGAATIE